MVDALSACLASTLCRGHVDVVHGGSGAAAPLLASCGGPIDDQLCSLTARNTTHDLIDESCGADAILPSVNRYAARGAIMVVVVRQMSLQQHCEPVSDDPNIVLVHTTTRYFTLKKFSR